MATGAAPKDSARGNIADARRFYDALKPGMPAAKAMAIMGHTNHDKRKFGTSKDFGYYGKPETVELAVYIADGKLARVAITYPNGKRKGQVVDEKGMSAGEYGAL